MHDENIWLLLQHLKYDISMLFWWGAWHLAQCPLLARSSTTTLVVLAATSHVNLHINGYAAEWRQHLLPGKKPAEGAGETKKKAVFQSREDRESGACLLPAKVDSSLTRPAEGAVSVARVLLLPFQFNKNVKTVIEALVWSQRNYSCAALIWVEDIYNTLVDTLV